MMNSSSNNGEKIWNDLISKSNRFVNKRSQRHVVICTPSEETLNSFTKVCFPDGWILSLPLMDGIGYSMAEFHSSPGDVNNEELIDVKLYAMRFPSSKSSLEYLRLFLKENKDIEIFFLLDWSMQDQSNWLKNLQVTCQMLKENGYQLNNSHASIWCINSTYIYTLQRNTSLWRTQHIDLLQQVLRSFALDNGFAVYGIDCENESNQTTYKINFIAQLSHHCDKITVELTDFANISIPNGKDSVSLIQTVDENFSWNNIKNNQDKFQNKIPKSTTHKTKLANKEDNQIDQKAVSLEEDIAKGLEIDAQQILDQYKIDVQKELETIYNHTKAKGIPQDNL